MAKRKQTTPVLIDRQKFLLPKMEWFPLDDGTGFYVRDIGGRALLDFKELADKHEGETVGESLDILAFLVARGACDKMGHLIFTDEDIPMLIDKVTVTIGAALKIMELSGIVSPKNSPTSSTTTKSPVNSESQ